MGIALGRKVGITQGFDAEGRGFPVTVIKVGPCKVVGTRKKDREGYGAVVVGFEEVSGAKLDSKPLLGFYKKAGQGVFANLREFRDVDLPVGQDLGVDQFVAGDKLEIAGISKGHGWTSVIKKWNFHRGRQSHGGNCKRKQGSTGQHTWPARVIRGRKMPGRWGSEKVTIKAVEVVQTVPGDALLLVKGPLPGNRGGILKIRKVEAKKKKSTNKAA